MIFCRFLAVVTVTRHFLPLLCVVPLAAFRCAPSPSYGGTHTQHRTSGWTGNTGREEHVFSPRLAEWKKISRNGFDFCQFMVHIYSMWEPRALSKPRAGDVEDGGLGGVGREWEVTIAASFVQRDARLNDESELDKRGCCASMPVKWRNCPVPKITHQPIGIAIAAARGARHVVGITGVG
jgi:hypothetical protein